MFGKRKKKVKNLEFNRVESPPVFFKIVTNTDPCTTVFIKKNIASAFNRLIYAHNVSRKIEEIEPVGISFEFRLRKTEIDYFIYLLMQDNTQILSEEETTSLKEIFENALNVILSNYR